MVKLKILLGVINKQIERFEADDMPSIVRCEVAALKALAKDIDKRLTIHVPSWPKQAL